jgi:hypothetical protein
VGAVGPLIVRPTGTGNTNVKLRVLAEQVAADFLAPDYDETLPGRGIYDRLLITAHTRVPPA